MCYKDCMTETNPFPLTTEAAYRERVTLVMDYIEKHLDEPLRLEALAKVAGFSPFHLHRIFSAFTALSLGEYVRRLRLKRAWKAVLETDAEITEIALEAGYETPSAFARVFRQYFQMSPSDLRRAGRSAAEMAMPAQPFLNRRTVMKPEIRTLSELHLIYVRKTGAVQNNFDQAADQAFTILGRYLTRHRLWKKIDLCLGICPDDPAVMEPEKASYYGCYSLKEGVEAQPEGEVGVMTIPAGRYAVFLHRGPYSTLWQTWGGVYHDWLPGSGMELRHQEPFEVYLEDKSRTPASQLRAEIYIPIV